MKSPLTNFALVNAEIYLCAIMILSGCDSIGNWIAEKTVETVVENAAEKKLGNGKNVAVDISKKNKEIKIETQDGEVTLNLTGNGGLFRGRTQDGQEVAYGIDQQLPKDFPKQLFPFYDQGQFIAAGGYKKTKTRQDYLLTFRTKQPPEHVIAFYKNVPGFEVETEAQAPTGHILSSSNKKAGAELKVIASKSPKDQATTYQMFASVISQPK